MMAEYTEMNKHLHNQETDVRNVHVPVVTSDVREQVYVLHYHAE